ncbi:hypothetical protein CKA34_05735 [Rhizobium sp. 11515TR]|nr:hypothetical protein CKA34_05735 [Rhizobium sp. 11515TR]
MTHRPYLGERRFPCKSDDHNHVNLAELAKNDCKIGAGSLEMPALCDIFGICEESNAFAALLQCER